MLENSRSQFLLDRLGRCLILFVSADSTSCHEFASAFGQTFVVNTRGGNPKLSRIPSRPRVVYLNKAPTVHCLASVGWGRDYSLFLPIAPPPHSTPLPPNKCSTICVRYSITYFRLVNLRRRCGYWSVLDTVSCHIRVTFALPIMSAKFDCIHLIVFIYTTMPPKNRHFWHVTQQIPTSRPY